MKIFPIIPSLTCKEKKQSSNDKVESDKKEHKQAKIIYLYRYNGPEVQLAKVVSLFTKSSFYIYLSIKLLPDPSTFKF